MKLDLTGKRALVTGSTAGIGHAIALGLAELGASVWVNGRTQARVDAAIASIRAGVPEASLDGIAADLATAEGTAAATEVLPDIDILVNNLGGIGGALKPFDALEDADWHAIYELNVVSGVRLTRAYLPGMRQRNWGRIVFVSSESGVQIPAEFVHYGVVKAAEIALARGIAEGLRGTGITVNSILPGPTRSEAFERMAERMGRSMDEVAEEWIAKSRPTSLIQRFTTTEEVANMAVYLCTDAASGTHGAALRVDGGVVKSAF